MAASDDDSFQILLTQMAVDAEDFFRWVKRSEETVTRINHPLYRQHIVKYLDSDGVRREMLIGFPREIYERYYARQLWQYAVYLGGFYMLLGMPISDKELEAICVGLHAAGLDYATQEKMENSLMQYQSEKGRWVLDGKKLGKILSLSYTFKICQQCHNLASPIDLHRRVTISEGMRIYRNVQDFISNYMIHFTGMQAVAVDWAGRGDYPGNLETKRDFPAV